MQLARCSQQHRAFFLRRFLMARTTKRDVAQDITNLIIAKIEAGTLPWRRPWKKTGTGGAPLRAGGQRYTGINSLYLWAVADSFGYSSRYWMTYRQGIFPNNPFHAGLFGI